MHTVKGSKPHNGVPKIRGLSQTEPRGQGGALWGACAQTCDTSKNTIYCSIRAIAIKKEKKELHRMQQNKKQDKKRSLAHDYVNLSLLARLPFSNKTTLRLYQQSIFQPF